METLNSREVLQLHPIDIYYRIDKVYGDEDWLGWETDTLLDTVFEERSEDIDPIAMDKVMAVQAAAANSDLAVTAAVALEKVVHAFCNNPCVADTFQPPEVEELTYAIQQLGEIIKEVHGQSPEFSCETPGYVAAVGIHHGWLILPRPLGFAQQYLLSLSGMKEHSVKWQANQPLIEMGRQAIDLFELGDFTDIDELIGDDFAASFIGRIVGAYIFDPTQT